MTSRLTPVLGGVVEAPVLKLDEPISFWGGVDQRTGTIIDVSHPQKGVRIGRQCLAVALIRGSGGTPGNLADTIRHDCGPAAIVIGYPDINVMTGVEVALKLYGKRCPLFVANDDQLRLFTTGMVASIESNGQFSLRSQ